MFFSYYVFPLSLLFYCHMWVHSSSLVSSSSSSFPARPHVLLRKIQSYILSYFSRRDVAWCRGITKRIKLSCRKLFKNRPQCFSFSLAALSKFFLSAGGIRYPRRRGVCLVGYCPVLRCTDTWANFFFNWSHRGMLSFFYGSPWDVRNDWRKFGSNDDDDRCHVLRCINMGANFLSTTLVIGNALTEWFPARSK